MYIFEVDMDRERTWHAGAAGMYQIMRLLLNGKDVTDEIDQGMMFHDESNLNDLTEYLSDIFKIPKNKISYANKNPEDHPDWPFK